MAARNVGVKVGRGVGFVGASLWKGTVMLASATGELGEGFLEGTEAGWEDRCKQMDANQLATPAEGSPRLQELQGDASLYNYFYIDNEALQKELLTFLKGADIWRSILDDGMDEVGAAIVQAHAFLATVQDLVVKCSGLEKGSIDLNFFTPDGAQEAEWEKMKSSWEAPQGQEPHPTSTWPLSFNVIITKQTDPLLPKGVRFFAAPGSRPAGSIPRWRSPGCPAIWRQCPPGAPRPGAPGTRAPTPEAP